VSSLLALLLIASGRSKLLKEPQQMQIMRSVEFPDDKVWLLRLEVGYSARSDAQARAVSRTPPVVAIPVGYLTPAIEDRAIEVQLLLADRGKHRAPSIPDLIIAATAELAGLTLLHLDKDFDLIGDVTGQRVERLRA
jgi:predicted nucleic acid-binding protein